jgi:exocyst complex component 8
MPSLPGIASNSTAPDGARLKEEQDARWITDFTDDLTVAIAFRNWSAAVDLVLQGTFLNGKRTIPISRLLSF